MIKLQVKTSDGWRSLHGARHFSRIHSSISTAYKQRHAALDPLTDLFAGKAWLPATT